MNNQTQCRKVKRSNRSFNDLLIPIILILTILPIIIYLKKYDCGLEKYPWYSSNGEISDFYSYYRSRIFIIISLVAMVILIFLFGLYKEMTREMRIFLPLGIYYVGIITSTIFSKNLVFSLQGTFYCFENVFVLLGYGVICIYSYQIVRKREDTQCIFWFMSIGTLVIAIWGSLQLFGIYPIEMNWFQKLYIPSEYHDSVGKIMNVFRNTVVAAFYNPDYAGEYLSMIIPVFMALVLVQKSKVLKVLFSVFTCLLVVLMWFTHYRGGLIAIGLTAIVVMPILLKRFSKKWLLLVIVVSVLFILDVALNIGKLSGVSDKTQNYTMEYIEPQKDGVYFKSINGNAISISIENNRLMIKDDKGMDITRLYNQEQMTLNYSGYEDVIIQQSFFDRMSVILVQFDQVNWTFAYNKEKGYIYINDALKEDVILADYKTELSHYEYLGSGRLYIWLRTIPILKNYFIIGSGPNTFPIVFPQNDYVGKYHVYLNSSMIVDKAHNNYLMTWVQSGFLSLVGFLVFYLIYFFKTYRYYLENQIMNYHSIMGFGCFCGTIIYMINGFFIDSSIYVSPIFWVLLGISMAEVCISQGDNMFYRINKKYITRRSHI